MRNNNLSDFVGRVNELKNERIVENSETGEYIYKEEDKELIPIMQESIKEIINDIMNFFMIEKQLKPTVIVAQNKNEFDSLVCSLDSTYKTVPKWLRAVEFGKKYIIILSMNDYDNFRLSKRFDSKEEVVNVFKQRYIHEYIHFIIEQLPNIKHLNRCLNEGLAILISGEMNNRQPKFNAELENIFSNYCYHEWYLVTKYILDKFGKEYLLELLLDDEHAKIEITKIFNKIKKYYNKK